MNEFIKKRLMAEKAISPIIKRTKETVQSGIYLYERTDEYGLTYFYVGQAVNVYERQIGHWNGYQQRIDFSIRSRKFYSEDNPYGWKFKVLEYCAAEDMNARETFYIIENMKAGKQTYNRTFGSQGEGKVDIGIERKPTKGYRDGVKQGYENARREVKHLFDLHLNVSVKKDGNKNQEKALQKFRDFLEG